MSAPQDDPWKDVESFQVAPCGAVYLADEVDAARAAVDARHQAEIAEKDETIRQLEMEIGLRDQWARQNPRLHEAQKLSATVEQQAARITALEQALRDIKQRAENREHNGLFSTEEMNSSKFAMIAQMARQALETP